MSSRKTILINAVSLTQQGGGRSYVRNLLRELNEDDRGFDFTLLAAPDTLTPEESGRFEVVEARLPVTPGASRTLLRVAYEQFWMPFRISNFDLLYCLADLSPMWSPIPTVVALRNFNIYDRRFYDTPRTRALFRLVKLGVRNAACVITPSHAAAKTIGPLVGLAPDDIQVVYHGISSEAFHPGSAPEQAQGARYLFLPANLERHKNLPLLFEMLPLLSDSEMQLFIAGGDRLDPEWGAELRAMVKDQGLEDRVRFLGPVPYENVLQYYRGAQALVFPSKLETFGHPILEAMLSSTPVVAADIESFRELAGDAGLYFPLDDPAALAARVDETVRDREATAKRVAIGQERAKRFTWKASTDQLCAAFTRALEENRK